MIKNYVRRISLIDVTIKKRHAMHNTSKTKTNNFGPTAIIIIDVGQRKCIWDFTFHDLTV